MDLDKVQTLCSDRAEMQHFYMPFIYNVFSILQFPAAWLSWLTTAWLIHSLLACHQHPRTMFLVSPCFESHCHQTGVCYVSTNNRPLSVFPPPLHLPAPLPSAFTLWLSQTLEPTDALCPCSHSVTLLCVLKAFKRHDGRQKEEDDLFSLLSLSSLSLMLAHLPQFNSLCFLWLIAAP